jgi:hypothetical protein
MLPSTPASAPRLFPPQLRLPATYTPKPYHYATYARYTGRVLDRVVGSILFVLTLIGAGSAIWGFINFFAGIGAVSLWRSTS